MSCVLRRSPGFTLLELVVVVAIVATLLLVILPAYQGQLLRVRRLLGAAELLQVVARQEQFFLDHKRYAQHLSELGYPGSPYAIDGEDNAVAASAGDRIYLIELSTMARGYALHARPQHVQAADTRCGTLVLHSTGERDASGEGGSAACWSR